MDDRPGEICCCKISYETGANLIGIFCCLITIQSCLCACFFREALLFFVVNAVLYGIVSLVFLWHVLAPERFDFLYRSIFFFYCFFALVYGGGNLWNLIYWLAMPGMIHKGCNEEDECIEKF